MIEHLRIGCSAYFYSRAKTFTDTAVETLFSTLIAAVENAGDCLIRDVRRMQNGAKYSAICFPYERPLAYFSEDVDLADTVHGYMLLIEHGDLISIHKSGLEIPPAFKTEWLRKVTAGSVERAIATADAKFESVRMRSMSTSKQALRAKTLEANDLENAMPMAGAGRYVGQRFRVRRGADRYTATPGTGRIAQNKDRSGYVTAIDWSINVMNELASGTGGIASFIENFARPVDLTSLPATTNPTNLAIDTAELADQIFSENPTIKLTRKIRPKAFRELTIAECRQVLNALDREFLVQGARSNPKILNAADNAEVGTINWGKTRLGPSTFALAETGGIYIGPADNAIAEDQQTPLKMYLDQEDLFIVLFDDVTVAYLSGELFQDKTMCDGGASFLSHLVPEECLKSVSSEKGRFRTNQKTFSSTSVFGKIDRTIAKDDDILICDDLGDEWADFIGMNTGGTPPMVTFYHAKHGDVSLGASSFHISVGQAEKNLGRLPLPVAAMSAKFTTWETKPYENDKTKTAISRLIRGGPRTNIENHLNRLRHAPDVVRRVSIVTSSLSYQAVEDEFTKIKNGGRPTAHFVQLYWLLTSFFAACAEVGAIGYVICQP